MSDSEDDLPSYTTLAEIDIDMIEADGTKNKKTLEQMQSGVSTNDVKLWQMMRPRTIPVLRRTDCKTSSNAYSECTKRRAHASNNLDIKNL